MSNKYKHDDYVPTEVLVNRLYELSMAVAKGADSIAREFTMRIPAELDRDADLVISQAAERLKAHEKQNAALVEFCREVIESNEYYGDRDNFEQRLKQIIGEE